MLTSVVVPLGGPVPPAVAAAQPDQLMPVMMLDPSADSVRVDGSVTISVEEEQPTAGLVQTVKFWRSTSDGEVVVGVVGVGELAPPVPAVPDDGLVLAGAAELDVEPHPPAKSMAATMTAGTAQAFLVTMFSLRKQWRV